MLLFLKKKMNHLDNITAIVFDLGGVIIDLDIDKTRKELFRLLGVEQPNLYYSNNHIPLFSDYEIGKISDSEFIDGLLKQSINGTTREDIINGWNAMLVTIPQKRINMLEKLGERYRIFILSNTNSIHTERFEKMASGHNTLSELFEKSYYSHIIGHRKPHRAAFETVINNSKLKAATTLFVDDLTANIETARSLGFKTLHVEPGMEIADILL